MYTVTVVYRQSSLCLGFTFKAFKNADDLFKKFSKAINSSEVLSVGDDYGSRATLDMASISSVSFTDIAADMDMKGEQSIMQAKANLKAQNMAKNDVGMRLLSDQVNPPNKIVSAN